MGIIVAKFQTNDKPWSNDFTMESDWEQEWARRLRPFVGPFHERMQGDQFGPYRVRKDAVDHVTARMSHEGKAGDTFFVANKNGKGVRAHIQNASPEEAFGKVYHTYGSCKDDYSNMSYGHNGAGQLLHAQKPAILAFNQAERMAGQAIRITGEGFRSCSLQTHLYYSDPGRFANPANSRHCRGLAFDIYFTPSNLTPRAKQALQDVGFCFGVSGEPWHCAFTECA